MNERILVPEWVCTVVGRLVLDNEALRQQVAVLQSAVSEVVSEEDGTAGR